MAILGIFLPLYLAMLILTLAWWIVVHRRGLCDGCGAYCGRLDLTSGCTDEDLMLCPQCWAIDYRKRFYPFPDDPAPSFNGVPVEDSNGSKNPV